MQASWVASRRIRLKGAGKSSSVAVLWPRGRRKSSYIFRCQNHPRKKSRIPDLGHCRAWGCSHCHCILFLTYLQVPENISVHIWPYRSMFDAGLSLYLLCKSRTWVWRRASGFWWDWQQTRDQSPRQRWTKVSKQGLEETIAVQGPL